MKVKPGYLFVGAALVTVVVAVSGCCGACASLKAKFYTAAAEGYLEDGDYAEAVEAYDEALAADPENVKNWCNRGYSLARLGEYDKALASFESALTLDPGDPWAWYTRGVTLGIMGEYDRALGCLNRALELRPGYADAWLAKGDIYTRVGSYKKALSYFDKVLEVNPADKEAWVSKSEACRLMGNYKEAVKCLNQALSIDPDYSRALGMKGIFLLDKGQYETATECFDRVLETDREERWAWYYKGLALFLQRDYGIAAGHFKTAVEVDPFVVNTYDLYYYLSYYISQARLGREAGGTLGPALRGDCREWPYPAVRFFSGQITAGQLIAAAGGEGQPLTDAHCYIGYKNKFDGDDVQAFYHFRSAMKAAEKAGGYVTSSPTYLMAKHEMGK
ncbi:MAG: tetratricopeptide repeat protein [Candidatus Zixiibacteriota bacterium]|jgi:tetratricopeptide (TPR) repeat protein